MLRPPAGLALLLLVTLCECQESAHGTLVAVIPAHGGVVIAADTRATVLSRPYCDGATKLIIPKKRKQTVIFQTNDGLWYPPIKGKIPENVCEAMLKTQPMLDLGHFVSEEVDLRAGLVLTPTEIQRIADDCIQKIAKYNRDHPHALKEDANNIMFQAVVVFFDIKSESTLVGSFTIVLDTDEKPFAQQVGIAVLAKTDQVTPRLFGETNYVAQNVVGLNTDSLAPFRSVVGPPMRTFSQLSISDAKSAALSIIETTEEVTKTIPLHNGIGGPIDVFTITKTGTEKERH
jgi:hypothetical protein